MSYLGTKDFLQEVAKGNVAKHSFVHKFGRNDSVGTSFEPVTVGGIYPTPQASGAVRLRVKAGGNANDTAAGTGAREITLEGLGTSGQLVSETLATAGASASSGTTTSFIRLFRAYVSASGTYATASAGSHSGDIVIEDTSGTSDYATISSSGFPRGATEIGAYSVPDGYTAYLESSFGFTDSSKTTTLLFFQRTNILQTSAPYDAMRVVFEERVEGGEFTIDIDAPLAFVGPCDIGYMAMVNTGTAEVDVDFELLLVQD